MGLRSRAEVTLDLLQRSRLRLLRLLLLLLELVQSLAQCGWGRPWNIIRGGGIKSSRESGVNSSEGSR